MKKTIIAAMLALAGLAANAQVFVGGTMGVSTEKQSNIDRYTTFTFAPTVGYNFNDKISAGIEFAYTYGDQGLLSQNEILLGPYARYNFFAPESVEGLKVFAEAAIYYNYLNLDIDGSSIDGNGVQIALRPGVSYMIGSNWQVLAKMNLFSFTHMDGSSSTGFGVNPTKVSFGVAYNF